MDMGDGHANGDRRRRQSPLPERSAHTLGMHGCYVCMLSGDRCYLNVVERIAGMEARPEPGFHLRPTGKRDRLSRTRGAVAILDRLQHELCFPLQVSTRICIKESLYHSLRYRRRRVGHL